MLHVCCVLTTHLETNQLSCKNTQSLKFLVLAGNALLDLKMQGKSLKEIKRVFFISKQASFI